MSKSRQRHACALDGNDEVHLPDFLPTILTAGAKLLRLIPDKAAYGEWWLESQR